MLRVPAFEVAAYRHFAIGVLLFLTGTWIQKTAVGWLIWERTQSSAWLSAFAVAELGPALVFSPFAGMLVDHLDPIRVVRFSQVVATAQAVLLTLVLWSSTDNLALMIALYGCRGLVAALYLPAAYAAIPRLAMPDHVASATAITSVATNAAAFIGPALAGFMLTIWGPLVTFVCVPFFHLAFLWAVSGLQTAPVATNVDKSLPREKNSVSSDSKSASGVFYGFAHGRSRLALIALLAISVAARPIVDLLPALSAHFYGAGVERLSTLASGLGLGAVAGGLWMARKKASAYSATIRTVGLASLCTAASILLLLISPFLSAGLLAITILGGTIAINGVGTTLALFASVPNEYHGRTMSLFAVMFRGGQALGALIIGFAADHLGFLLPMLACTFFCVLVGYFTVRGGNLYERYSIGR